MSNVIVAGIINKNTGEITDTTTKAGEKTAIRLKVRDELGCKHGRGDFMSFEFSTLCSMSYYRKNMINKDPNVFRGLEILNAKYRIQEQKRIVERAQKELSIAETVADDCANLYPNEEDKAKLTLVNDVMEEAVREAQEAVEDATSNLNDHNRRLKKLVEAEEAYQQELSQQEENQ